MSKNTKHLCGTPHQTFTSKTDTCFLPDITQTRLKYILHPRTICESRSCILQTRIKSKRLNCKTNESKVECNCSVHYSLKYIKLLYPSKEIYELIIISKRVVLEESWLAALVFLPVKWVVIMFYFVFL